MKYIVALLFILLSWPLTLSAQGRSCGMEAYMESLRKDPARVKVYNANQRRFQVTKQMLSAKTFSQMNTLYIPVAIHFPEGNESDRSCLEALAQDQIDRVNKDYQGVNFDAPNWATASTFYPNTVMGMLDVEFCIATQNHPTDVSGNFIDPDLVEGRRYLSPFWINCQGNFK